MKSLDRLEVVVERLLLEMRSLREENGKLKQEMQKMKGVDPLRNREALTRLKGVIEKLESFSITKS